MLHEKYHNSNHHTLTSTAGDNADASLDAFASHDQPFQGDFVLNGTFTSIDCDDKNYAGNICTASSVIVSGTSYGIEGEGDVYINGDIQVNHLILTDTTLNMPLSDAFITNKIIYSNNTNKQYCFRLWDLDSSLSAKYLPPYFKVQPTIKNSTINNSNSTITFSCEAVGDELTYQWFRNGVALSDEKNNSLTVFTGEGSNNIYYVEARTNKTTINGISATKSFNVTLKEKPLFKEDYFTIPFGTQDYTLDVLANDITYGQQIYINSYTQPRDGVLNFDQKNNIFVYRCNSTYKGFDSFQYTVKDFLGRLGTVNVHLSSIIIQPQITNKNFNVSLHEPTQISVIDEKDNLGNIPYTFKYTKQATKGSVLYDNNNSLWKYIPLKNFNGLDSFEVTITNAVGLSSTALMTVTADYQAPIVADDNFTIGLNRRLTFSVFSNDTLKSLNYYIKEYTTPLHGDLKLENKYTGEFTYYALSGFIDKDQFTYTISDETGATSTAVVYLSTSLPDNWQYGSITYANNDLHAASWANLQVDRGVIWKDTKCIIDSDSLQSNNDTSITTQDGTSIQ